jgi:hypothetical protein
MMIRRRNRFMIREIHTEIRTGRAPRARGRNTMIRNGHTGGYKVLGLIPGLAVAFFAVGVTAVSAQAQECEAGSFHTDPYQCEQPRAIELGVSGSSIEHIIDGAFAFCYTGTLGSLVHDGSNQYILSNNHVLAKENEPDSDLLPDVDGYEIIQPGLLDEGACSLSLGDDQNVVALLTDYVEIVFGRGRKRPDNRIDAAIAITDANSVLDRGEIRGVGVLTGDPDLNPASQGDKVQKSGRTTGHTFGEVMATDVTINVRYNSGTARFVDQIEVVGLCDTDFSAGGDSGSLIVTLRDGEPRAAVGLLFAGGGASTFANTIENVLTDMGEVAGATLSMVHTGAGNVTDVDGNTDIPTCTPVGGNVQASDDSYNLPKKSTALTVDALGVLENDTGSNLTATLFGVQNTDYGFVDFSSDGSFIYTYTGADRNGDGSDSFSYTASDGATTSDTATVTINLATKGGGRPPRSANGPAAVGLELARQIKADHEDELFDIPGVQGSGIGTDAAGNAVIRVYVESPAQSADRPIPAHIEGVPVKIIVTGEIVAR